MASGIGTVLAHLFAARLWRRPAGWLYRWSGGIAAFAYALIGELHKEMYFRWKWVLFPYVSAILFAFALLGIFGSSQFIWLRNLDSFWCYAAIVWGFFLLAMTEQLLEPLRRRRTERSTA